MTVLANDTLRVTEIRYEDGWELVTLETIAAAAVREEVFTVKFRSLAGTYRVGQWLTVTLTDADDPGGTP